MGAKASKPGGRQGADAAARPRLGSAAWEAHEPRQPGEPPRILFIGPEAAGKTALLEALHTRMPAKKLKNPLPSRQPRAFDLTAQGRPFTAVDQPGADKLRAWWAGALKEADGVVFACDSSDTPQLKLLGVTFSGLVPLLNARRAPLLLLATKQDVQGSMSPGRLAASLALVDGHPPLTVPFATRGCTLLKGTDELEAALAWVVQRALPARRPAVHVAPDPREQARRQAAAKRKKKAQTRNEDGYNVRAVA